MSHTVNRPQAVQTVRLNHGGVEARCTPISADRRADRNPGVYLTFDPDGRGLGESPIILWDEEPYNDRNLYEGVDSLSIELSVNDGASLILLLLTDPGIRAAYEEASSPETLAEHLAEDAEAKESA